jgi:predicted GNAT family acetyltransferase
MITRTWEGSGEGRFEYRKEEGAAVTAFMDILQTDSNMLVIKHTEVDPSLGGQGIGKQLVNAAATYAQEKALKILPVCPFAKNIMFRDLEKYKGIM